MLVPTGSQTRVRPTMFTIACNEARPFEVMSIYSFEGDKCSRVEFVR